MLHNCYRGLLILGEVYLGPSTNTRRLVSYAPPVYQCKYVLGVVMVTHVLNDMTD